MARTKKTPDVAKLVETLAASDAHWNPPVL